jgi:lipoprotein-releasing system permease protein
VIHKIAIASVGLGLAVMLISFMILRGFQENIRNRVASFGGHLQVTRYAVGNVYGENPMPAGLHFAQNPGEYDFVEHVQAFAYKPGLLRTAEEVQGVVLKGIGPDFSLRYFKDNMVSGRVPLFTDTAASTKVVISQRIADKMKLELDDEVIIYFVQNPPRFRRLQIEGIYNTGMEDFDEALVLGDINLIRQLNNWPDTVVGGYEVYIKDFDKLEEAQEALFDATNYNYFVDKVTDRNIQIFEWLSLLDRNVVIFLGIILFVAFFNIISILLILIMERTPMIGTLLALGSSPAQLRRIFLYNGMQMVLKGMLWGNLIGLGLGALQYYFKLIPLDKENYYMDFVPIQWNLTLIVLLNVVLLMIGLLVMLIPTVIIARIQPIKAIKFS